MALGREHFTWRGLELLNRGRPVLTLVADEIYPHLFRIRYPNGWTSTSANISRCKDAAYAHARALLKQKDGQSAAEAPHSGEVEELVSRPRNAGRAADGKPH